MRLFLSDGLVATALGSGLLVTGALSAAAQVARPHAALALDGGTDLLVFVRGGGGGGGGGGDRGGGDRGGSGRGSADRGGSRGHDINIDRGSSRAGSDRDGSNRVGSRAHDINTDRASSRGDANRSSSRSRDRQERTAERHRDHKPHHKPRKRDRDSNGFNDDRAEDALAYCVKRNRSGQVVGGIYTRPDGKPRFCP